MNAQERLDLKRIMQQSGDYEDNTDGIRRLKHSDLIQADVAKIEALKKELADLRKESPSAFQAKCIKQCSFLYNAYTDIFNRLLKDELDLGLLSQALVTLKKIENGEIDQQEGSVMMGKILHRVFVESATKRGENLDAIASEPSEPKNNGETISWKEYKNRQK